MAGPFNLISTSFLIGVLWCLTCQGESENVTSLFINSVVEKGYDKLTRPHTSDPDLTVDVFISLARTVDISEEDMSITVELYLYQKWHDERLSFAESELGDSILGGHDLLNHSWDPKSYFPMAKIEQFDKSDTFFKVMSNGTAIMVTRSIVSFPCTYLKRNHEPSMDELECQIRIASFLYGGQFGGLRYSWVTGRKAVQTIPIRLDFHDYRFVKEVLDQESDSSYRSISARLIFRRRVGILCRLVVLPSLICVSVAVLAMYMPFKYSGVRMSLSAVALLFGTSILMLSASRSDKFQTTNFLDRYLYGCLVAIGLTMVDHLLVTYRVVLNRKSRSKSVDQRDPRNIPGQPYRMVPKHTDHQRLLLQCAPSVEHPDSKWKKCVSGLRQAVTWVLAVADWLIRLAVPAFFVVFVLHCKKDLFEETRFEPQTDPLYLEEELSYGVPARHWT